MDNISTLKKIGISAAHAIIGPIVAIAALYFGLWIIIVPAGLMGKVHDILLSFDTMIQGTIFVYLLPIGFMAVMGIQKWRFFTKPNSRIWLWPMFLPVVFLVLIVLFSNSLNFGFLAAAWLILLIVRLILTGINKIIQIRHIKKYGTPLKPILKS